MDGFSGYNQIEILPSDQHKMAFIFPWGTFAYKKLPFGLKNTGTTFQRAMSYAFHDIKHIVEPYLDDLGLIHSGGRTILVILERYSLDFVIIIYGSICINVFFALRRDVCLALWYPKMASGSIL